MDEKPSLIEYIVAQNNDLYRITGVISNSVIADTYRELKYNRNKFIVDSILILLYITVMTYGMLLTILVFGPVIQHLYDKSFYGDVYNPNAGVEYALIQISISIIWSVFFIIAVPIIMKMIRSLFGLRWFFVEFDAVKSSDQDQTHMDSYLEFYNNMIAFQSDRYLDSKRKIEVLKTNCYPFRLKAITIIYQLYLRGGIPIIIARAFILEMTHLTKVAAEVLVINVLITVLLYLLSLILSYKDWKNNLSI